MASLATAIPEELLAEIFLRLPDPADLARVSGTCPIFRRLAIDRSFLRRYRKRHPPPFLGFVDYHKAFHPALPPHPSAPAARAVALAADFSFSFLPTPARSWVIEDVRDGRVLLLDSDPRQFTKRRVFTDLAVCDPLYRQYLLLPSVPNDLALEGASAFMRWCEPFFVPPSEEEGEALAEETTFRVMLMVEYETSLVVLDFSSSSGQWRAASSKGSGDLFPAAVISNVQARRYTNYPPSLLSSPTVCSGIHKGTVEEMLEQGAKMLQAEARSSHDQNVADAVVGGQADVLEITDGAVPRLGMSAGDRKLV